jgi:hypothetical protein
MYTAFHHAATQNVWRRAAIDHTQTNPKTGGEVAEECAVLASIKGRVNDYRIAAAQHVPGALREMLIGRST